VVVARFTLRTAPDGTRRHGWQHVYTEELGGSSPSPPTMLMWLTLRRKPGRWVMQRLRTGPSLSEPAAGLPHERHPDVNDERSRASLGRATRRHAAGLVPKAQSGTSLAPTARPRHSV